LAKDLFDDPRSSTNLNSRLTYSGLTTGTYEAYGRVDTSFGSFFKGDAGFGGLGRGSLDDEDFPPAIVPYSSTLSQQQGGKLAYASVDYPAEARPSERRAVRGLRLSGGKRQCLRLQSDRRQSVCVPAISTGIVGITEQTQWQFVRLD
jgi:hypothetical protein